jgi:hypothetical protein
MQPQGLHFYQKYIGFRCISKIFIGILQVSLRKRYRLLVIRMGEPQRFSIPFHFRH